MKSLIFLSALILVLTVTPITAQEQVPNTVSFNGFSFSFDSEIATRVNITQYLTEPADVFPPHGLHTHFVIYGEQPPDASIVGIRVYAMNDLATHEHTQAQVSQLQAMLAEQRDLATYTAGTENPLPFLPVVAAGQIIRARAHYVVTSDVTGISYITAYQQGPQPFLQQDFLYTFQGVSADGEYYISAVFRVNPEVFPTEMRTDFVYKTFLDELPDYLSESTTQLNEAQPSDFAPSLDMLDAVIQSIRFESN